MQIEIDVKVRPEEYSEKYLDIEYPDLRACPNCDPRVRLRGHGWYRRNALPSVGTELVVMIRRFLCPLSCVR